MTVTVRYPGPEAPGPCPIALDAPDGWTVSQPHGTTLVLTAAEPGPDGFVPNVVASQRRLPPGVPTAVVESGVFERLAELPQFEVAYRAAVAIDDREGFVFEFAFVKEPEHATIAQVQLNVLVRVADGHTFLITLTGSASPTDAAAQLDVLRSILLSLKIADTSALETGRD